MPELPDVEVFREYVDATSLHRRIAHTRVREDAVLEGVTARGLAQRLHDRRLTGTRRHGKYLGAALEDDGWLVLHFGMTGDLAAFEDAVEPEYTAVLLEFADDGRLAYTSRRKLGKVMVAEDFDAFVADAGLGPDALGLSLDAFRAALAGRRAKVKPLLMDQQIIAGAGNVYVDETLFHAGVRPGRSVQGLGDDEVRAVHRSLQHVLGTAIERRADPGRMPDSWLLPVREAGAACPGCGGEIRRTTVSGRATYWCPGCQR